MNPYEDRLDTRRILTTLARKDEVATTTPARHTALRAAAENLSLRNVDTATAELLSEALDRLIELLYQVDSGGLCNVDGRTGRILVALPFGRNGHRLWGLRSQESNYLRQILFDWQEQGSALLLYDRSRRGWYVNLVTYSSIGIAKAWVRAHPITVTLYRAVRSKHLAR